MGAGVHPSIAHSMILPTRSEGSAAGPAAALLVSNPCGCKTWFEVWSWSCEPRVRSTWATKEVWFSDEPKGAALAWIGNSAVDARVARPLDAQPLRAAGPRSARGQGLSSLHAHHRHLVDARRPPAPGRPSHVPRLSLPPRRARQVRLHRGPQVARAGRALGPELGPAGGDPQHRDRRHREAARGRCGGGAAPLPAHGTARSRACTARSRAWRESSSTSNPTRAVWWSLSISSNAAFPPRSTARRWRPLNPGPCGARSRS